MDLPTARSSTSHKPLAPSGSLASALTRASKVALDLRGGVFEYRVADARTAKDGESSAAPVDAGGAPDPGNLTSEAFVRGGALPPKAGVSRRRRKLGGEQKAMTAPPTGEVDALADPLLVDFAGLTICIDRPAGFVQTKVDAAGNVLWTRTYTTNYGYLPGTCGGDDDELDCFVGPLTSSDRVYWFYILDAAGAFDEYKLVFGASSEADALAIVLAHIPERFLVPACACTTMSQIRALLGQDPLGRETAMVEIAKSLDAMEPSRMDGEVDGETNEPAQKMLREEHGKWNVYSEDGSKHLGGPYDTKGEAVERLRQVEGHKAEKRAPDFVLKIKTNGVGYDCLKRLFENIEKLGAAGHSFGIQSDDSPPVQLGGWDGDGGARIEIVDVERIEHPKPRNDHTLKRDDGWHAYSEFDGSHVGGPFATKEEALAHVERKAATLKIVQKSQQDERYVLGVVLEPEVVDAQGEVYSAEVIRESAFNWLADYRNVDFQHKVFINRSVRVVESYIAPCDLTIDGQAVKAGTWLLALIIDDPALWAAIKRGELTGFSMNGLSRKEPL